MAAGTLGQQYEKIRAQALMSERLLPKQHIDIAIYAFVHVGDHTRNKPAVFIHKLKHSQPMVNRSAAYTPWIAVNACCS